MKIGVLPSRAMLMELFSYNPETGELKRRKDSGPAKAGNLAGTLHSTGYIDVGVSGTLMKAHRIIWMMVHGKWPEGEVDHINRIRNDNRIENLRDVSPVENMRNKTLYTNNKSGLAGVSFCRGKWHVAIKTKPYVQKHLGCFDNIFDAACARISAEPALGYHKNHGRTV